MPDFENQYQMTEAAQIIWVNVVKPKPSRKSKDGSVIQSRYENTFLLPVGGVDLKVIEGMMGKVAQATLGRVTNLSIPLRGGDKYANDEREKGKDREWARGHVLLTAHSNLKSQKGDDLRPPNLVAWRGGQWARPSDQLDPASRQLFARDFYSGVYAVGIFSFAAYAGMGGGVTCWLNEVASYNVGDRIATGVDDDARYGAPDMTKYVGKPSAIDPTAGISYN